MQAFDKFDRDESGQVDLNDLKDLYNAKHHPDVKAGKKTEDQVLNEFLTTFESYSDINVRKKKKTIINISIRKRKNNYEI